MERFVFIKGKNFDELPKTSGVYCFLENKNTIYIGKAINIRNRVKNHFYQPSYRDDLFMNKVNKIGFFETGSEIDALILEANLIKKYQPKFNVVWKDDKNYFYVAVAQNDQKIPYIFITHQKTLQKTEYIGPFVEGTALKKTLRVLRRPFPYYTTKNHPKVKCAYCHLGLCPGPLLFENPSASSGLLEYRKNIKKLILVLKGKRNIVLNSLKKEMAERSNKSDFEEAGKIRDKIFAFEKVLSHSGIIEKARRYENGWKKAQKILQGIVDTNKKISRIEGYDVSNTQGIEAVASMVVFVDGQSDKNLYRKFKIKTIKGPNDTAMIKEALSRRTTHSEWPLPDLMLIDGGKGQLNAALAIIKNVPIISLAKKNNELFIKGKDKPILLSSLPGEISNLILQIRDESHRFAIAYHKKLRKKSLLPIDKGN